MSITLRFLVGFGWLFIFVRTKKFIIFVSSDYEIVFVVFGTQGRAGPSDENIKRKKSNANSVKYIL